MRSPTGSPICAWCAPDGRRHPVRRGSPRRPSAIARREALARNTAAALARKRLLARTVVLKLRYSNFETITRSETRKPPTGSEDEIVARTVALLEKTDAGKRPVRLLGASVHGLVAESDAAEPATPAPPQLGLPVE